MLFAAPHRAELMQKTTIAADTIGLRPTISETRPFSGVMMVAPSRYDWYQSEHFRQHTVPTHEYSDGVASSSSAIVGSAVETILNQCVYRYFHLTHRHVQSSKKKHQSGVSGRIARTL